MEPTATHPDPEVPVTARSPSRTKAALAALAVAGMLTAFGAASVFAASPSPSPAASAGSSAGSSSGSTTTTHTCPAHTSSSN
jgi:hypothetical protein